MLRMAAVYGPRMKGNYLSLARALARNRFVPIGAGRNFRTLVYEVDAIRAAVLAADHPLAAGQVYNVSDGAVHRLREIIQAICESLGRRPPRFTVPLRAARLAAAAADRTLSPFGSRRKLAAAVEKYVETVSVRADRIQQELGFRPEYDLSRGWQQTIATMRKDSTLGKDFMVENGNASGHGENTTAPPGAPS